MLVIDSQADLKPLVAQVMEHREAVEAKLDGRLAFSESEAASLMGVERYVLRDCRLREEIKHTKIGRRIFYSRKALLKYIGEGSK